MISILSNNIWIYDRDLPDVPAVKVAPGGAGAMIEMVAQRIELEPWTLAVLTSNSELITW